MWVVGNQSTMYTKEHAPEIVKSLDTSSTPPDLAKIARNPNFPITGVLSQETKLAADQVMCGGI